MEKISKKKKLAPFIIFLFFSLTSLVGLRKYSSSSTEDLNSFILGAIFFSLYAFMMPWVLERFFLPRFRASKNRGRMDPEVLILLMSYTTLYFPVLAGVILYGLGLPITQSYYFMGAGILGALIWCGYTLRESATW